MKQINQFLPFLFLFGILMYGCDTVDTNRTAEKSDFRSHSNDTFKTSEGESALFGDYLETEIFGNKIEFTGRTQNLTNGTVDSTTFNYRVTNLGETSVSNNFFLELPACAGELTSFTPNNGQISNGAGGISWNPAIPVNGTREYSVTFSGDIALGIITTALTQASNTGTGTIAGPCAGTFTLSGSIFIDSNEDGVKQPFESGIENILISIETIDGEMYQTTLTSEGGSYSFSVPSGSYIISAPDNLFEGSYKLSTASSLEVPDVHSDISGLDFGYFLDTDQVINNLSDGTILTNTRSSQYWIFQMRHAGSRNPNSDFSEEEMLELLELVEDLLLPEPFQFGDDKIGDALRILTRPFRNVYDELLQQLLTAELNILSNKGAYTLVNGEIVLNNEFNNALLIFGESYACVQIGVCSNSSSLRIDSAGGTGTFSTSTLSDATKVFSSFNGTGGIGR